MCLPLFGISQTSDSEKPLERPKLVVGIVVDQMRQEYFYKYYDRYVDGGFKRTDGSGIYDEKRPL
jgi:hypothetical protein